MGLGTGICVLPPISSDSETSTSAPKEEKNTNSGQGNITGACTSVCLKSHEKGMVLESQSLENDDEQIENLIQTKNPDLIFDETEFSCEAKGTFPYGDNDDNRSILSEENVRKSAKAAMKIPDEDKDGEHVESKEDAAKGIAVIAMDSNREQSYYGRKERKWNLEMNPGHFIGVQLYGASVEENSKISPGSTSAKVSSSETLRSSKEDKVLGKGEAMSKKDRLARKDKRKRSLFERRLKIIHGSRQRERQQNKEGGGENQFQMWEDESSQLDAISTTESHVTDKDLLQNSIDNSDIDSFLSTTDGSMYMTCLIKNIIKFFVSHGKMKTKSRNQNNISSQRNFLIDWYPEYIYKCIFKFFS